jgi:hypothetical protein
MQGMGRLMDFLLDSASRNSLRSPSGPTGNAPAGRPSGPQPSHALACGWKSLRDSHIAPSQDHQQQLEPSIEIRHGGATLAAQIPARAGQQLTKWGWAEILTPEWVRI